MQENVCCVITFEAVLGILKKLIQSSCLALQIVYSVNNIHFKEVSFTYHIQSVIIENLIRRYVKCIRLLEQSGSIEPLRLEQDAAILGVHGVYSCKC